MLHTIVSKDFMTTLFSPAAAFIHRIHTERYGVIFTSESQSIPPGSDVSIFCQFDGRPVPTAVEWYRDGVLVESGIFTTEFNSTLNLYNFRSTAVYQCHVTNIHGSDTASVFLCLQHQGMYIM